MNQLDLFSTTTPARYDDMPEPAPVARARASDPESSKAAAAAVNLNGKAKRHRERVIDLVWQHPGNTSKGLVAFTDKQDKEDGLDRWEIARRLPEAEEAGEVYRVKEGTCELRWFPGRAT